MSITTTRITQAFPLDSMVTQSDSGDGLPVYDRPYNASDLRTIMGVMLTTGVCKDYLGMLEVYDKAGSYHVKAGCAVLDGLLAPVPEEKHVLDKADVEEGMYAHVIMAARFDDTYRDVTIHATVNSMESYKPTRTKSRCEIVLARIDWHGKVTDLRSEDSVCGWVASPYGPRGPVGPMAVTDAEMSETSENAVRNSVVTKEIKSLRDSVSQTIATGVTAVKVGGIVMVRVHDAVVNLPDYWHTHELGALPEGWRPAQEVSTPIAMAEMPTTARLSAESSGRVTVKNMSGTAIPGSRRIYGCLTYMAHA